MIRFRLSPPGHWLAAPERAELLSTISGWGPRSASNPGRPWSDRRGAAVEWDAKVSHMVRGRHQTQRVVLGRQSVKSGAR